LIENTRCQMTRETERADDVEVVFLSYARKDRMQARQLECALKARARHIWVDWSSIPPTAVWLEEVFRAIAAASAFVFAISPDSVTSDMCRLELDYAMRAGKRLIPLVFRETATELVPADLRRIQWIDFTLHQDLTGAVDQLLLAVDKDPEWVTFHTRLAVRAREWREDTENKSLLFRGAELITTERRVAENLNADPAPSSTQMRFLEASRWAARLNPPRSASILGIAGLVSSLLFGLELWEPRLGWQQAGENLLLCVFACAAFVLLRMSKVSSIILGLSLLVWHEAFVYVRRELWGGDWGSFGDSVSGGILGRDYEGQELIFGAMLFLFLAVVLACAGAKKSLILKPASVSLAWAGGLAAAAAVLLLLPKMAGSFTTDSMRVYSSLSYGIGFSVIGTLLGILPMATSALAESSAASKRSPKDSHRTPG
jgi:TIR domain